MIATESPAQPVGLIVVTRDREAIVHELRTTEPWAQRGETPAEVGTLLVRELGVVHNLEFELIGYMFHAFEISIKALKDAYDWVVSDKAAR